MKLNNFLITLVWLIFIYLNNREIESTKIPESDSEYIETFSGVYIFARTYNLRFYNPKSPRRKSPLLFVHGTFLSEQMWKTFISNLYEHNSRIMNQRTVIGVDIRGFGESQVFPYDADFSIDTLTQDIIQVLNYYNITKSIWCGYSLGGLITLHSAIYYSSYVDKLGLISSGPRLQATVDTSSFVFSAIYRNLPIYTLLATVINFYDYINNGYIDYYTGHRLLSDQYKVSYEAIQGVIGSLGTANYSGNIINKDCFIAWGIYDEFFDIQTQNELKNMFSNYVYYQYNDTNHGLPFVHTSDIADKYVNWI